MLVYGECECFVMQMLYVCVLCASCGSSQCCVLHDLQFVNGFLIKGITIDDLQEIGKSPVIKHRLTMCCIVGTIACI